VSASLSRRIGALAAAALVLPAVAVAKKPDGEHPGNGRGGPPAGVPGPPAHAKGGPPVFVQGLLPQPALEAPVFAQAPAKPVEAPVTTAAADASLAPAAPAPRSAAAAKAKGKAKGRSKGKLVTFLFRGVTPDEPVEEDLSDDLPGEETPSEDESTEEGPAGLTLADGEDGDELDELTSLSVDLTGGNRRARQFAGETVEVEPTIVIVDGERATLEEVAPGSTIVFQLRLPRGTDTLPDDIAPRRLIAESPEDESADDAELDSL
jgi:hypothetical protein